MYPCSSGIPQNNRTAVLKIIETVRRSCCNGFFQAGFDKGVIEAGKSFIIDTYFLAGALSIIGMIWPDWGLLMVVVLVLSVDFVGMNFASSGNKQFETKVAITTKHSSISVRYFHTGWRRRRPLWVSAVFIAAAVDFVNDQEDNESYILLEYNYFKNNTLLPSSSSCHLFRYCMFPQVLAYYRRYS